jgi:peptide/nickel transport system substrate-binding protein
MRRIHVINRRTKRIAAVAVGLSLIAAACGDDDGDGDDAATTEEATSPETTVADTSAEVPSETAADTTVADTSAPATETETATETASEPAAESAMTVTYTLSDVAVWNDGTPISAADFECTWQAAVNTPESLTTVGYDQIVAVTEGATPPEVVVDFNPPFAAWKTLFSGAPPILKHDEHDDCSDVSTDFTGAFTYGAMPYMMSEWTPEQMVFEPNPGYTGQYVPKTPRIVIVPAEDGPTLLKSGAVDFIFPQAYTGIDEELADPNIEYAAEAGGSYEGLYFQQDDNCVPDDTRSCAFADDVFREAFSKSIDIEGVYNQIYAPFAQGLPLLNCGPIAPGAYCDPVFQPEYDLEAAAALLEGAGWTKNAEGFWANAEGAAPEIHWMINTGNTRRESTQEFLIPQLAEAGFNVIADNCEALPCVFETRLPALSYDLAMYISTVAPDPIYLSSSFACEAIPTEENGFQGQNQTGWCNEEASEKLAQADEELDEATRATLVKEAIAAMAEDHMMLPTLQFPNVGAYRTDKVAGTQSNLANYWAFKDWWNFEDLDGDGQVVIGAEQYPTPDCPNPVTSCANSSWYVWTAAFPQFPSTYDTTNDQTFEPNEILAGEAVVSTP